MLTGSSSLYVLCSAFTLLLSTCWDKNDGVRKEDKIFHAGPTPEHSGFGTTFFTLHKGNEYQFCEGDFVDPGCYSGTFSLSGDTITLIGLKKHINLPTSRFLIIRYAQKDSSYWQWKYPASKAAWKSRQTSDIQAGATGDVWPLDKKGSPVTDRTNHFIIRQDDLKVQY